MNSTTPNSINENILNFCKEIDSTTNPCFVDVIPIKDAVYNRCHRNVEEYIKKNGGKAECGWIIWEIPDKYLDAEFHTVWVNDEGESLDITPKEDGEERILFLKDSKRKFTGELVDNFRKPLVDNAETRTMVLFGEKKFEINKKYYDGDMIKIPMFEIKGLEAFGRKVLLSEIQKDKLEGKIKIGRNEPCPCGSGKKYKKCCIVY